MTQFGVPASSLGPCSDWLDGADVAACCNVEMTDDTIFDAVAKASQEILFLLSGRLFAGLCERRVRPCSTRSRWPFQVLSRGHLVWGYDTWGWGGSGWGWGNWWGAWETVPCGCWPLSRVKLAGYPVQDIVEVKIDGNVVNPVTYRLDRHRYLTRVRDPAHPDVRLLWPCCQNLDEDDTEKGTWSVTYQYGQEPPLIGVTAAAQLACEMYKDCQGQPCALPKGTTQMTRQGVTINKLAITDWVFVPTHLPSRGSQRTSGWRTGIPAVDMFLNSANPDGVKKRPIFWSPSASHRYAQPVG